MPASSARRACSGSGMPRRRGRAIRSSRRAPPSSSKTWCRGRPTTAPSWRFAAASACRSSRQRAGRRSQPRLVESAPLRPRRRASAGDHRRPDRRRRAERAAARLGPPRQAGMGADVRRDQRSDRGLRRHGQLLRGNTALAALLDGPSPRCAASRATRSGSAAAAARRAPSGGRWRARAERASAGRRGERAEITLADEQIFSVTTFPRSTPARTARQSSRSPRT